MSQNLNGSVVFTMSLVIHTGEDEIGEAAYGQSVDSR